MRKCWILGTGEAKNGQPVAAVFAGLNALPHEQKTPQNRLVAELQHEICERVLTIPVKPAKVAELTRRRGIKSPAVKAL